MRDDEITMTMAEIEEHEKQVAAMLAERDAEIAKLRADLADLRSKATAQVSLAIEKLDALTDDDPETAHGSADAILCELTGTRVSEAFSRAAQRIGFWYA